MKGFKMTIGKAVFYLVGDEFPKYEFTQIKNIFFNYKMTKDERIDAILKYCADNGVGMN